MTLSSFRMNVECWNVNLNQRFQYWNWCVHAKTKCSIPNWKVFLYNSFLACCHCFFCLGSFDGFHTTHGIFLGNFTGKFRIIIGNKISKKKVVCFSSFTLYIKTSAKKQNLKIKIFRETRFFSVVKTSIIHSLERTTPNVMLDFLVSRWRDDTFLKHPLKFFDDTSQAE